MTDKAGVQSVVERPFNKLAPAEAERLALLLEEMGEAQQAIGKILRHGYESVNPFIAPSPTNRESLEREMGDVMAALQMLTEVKDLDAEKIENRRGRKRMNVGGYMHHQNQGASHD